MTKIEDIPITSCRTSRVEEFSRLLGKLEVGQSFLWQGFDSNYRHLVSGIQYAMERKFVSKREGDMHRIGRTS